MQKRDNKFLMNSFFRPSEVLVGKNFSERMLVASTQSKWYDEKKVVGECRVLHISQIYDMEQYCLVEDNFYFEQLYDLYAKEIYDVARSNLTRLSDDKVKSLMFFPFLYVEVGHTLDIINGTGWCGICRDFCMPSKTEETCFECQGCKNRYHYDCFDLSDLLDQERLRCNMCFNDEKPVNWIDSDDSGLKLLTSFKDFDTTPLDVESMNLEWSFRYFGIHSNEESALDTDYSIVFPRCSVKVGPTLQVRIPKLVVSQDAMDIDSPEQIEEDMWLARYGKQLQQQMDDEEQVDRTTFNHLKYRKPASLSTDKVNEFVKSTCHELLGTAEGSCQFKQYLYELLFINDFDFMKTKLHSQKMSLCYLFSDDTFSKKPIFPLPRPVRWLEDLQFGDGPNNILINEIKEKGHVLYKIADATKIPIKAICQYFAMWKKTEVQRQAYDSYLKKYMNLKKFDKEVVEQPDNTHIVKHDEEISLHETDMDESSDGESALSDKFTTPHCDNCYKTNPETLIPTTIFQGRHSKKRREMFCKDCGTFWLKFASTKSVNRELKSTNKSQLFDTGRRNRRGSTTQGQTSFQAVPPRPIIPHIPCGVCLDDIPLNEEGNLLEAAAVKCTECKIVVHKICYDIPRFIGPTEAWKCDVCIKEIKKDSCCLCGKIDPQVTACKAFQGNMAHAVCLYTNDSFMFSKIDGIREPILYKDIVDTQDLTCYYCNQSTGWKTCCVMEGCTKWFHPVCSTRANSSFTFFDKSMRFFCSEHMTPMIPYDIHDPIASIKDTRRATKMMKIQENLRYKRTELGKITTPKFDRKFSLQLYCDPKIDTYKQPAKRTMRKSSAHMKVPEFPPCLKCLTTAYPVLWVNDTWKCISCVRTDKNEVVEEMEP